MHSSNSSPSWDRLLHILNALNAQRNVTSVVLAEEMGVSERTVKRYISYMRNDLGVEIIWEPTSRSYYCPRIPEYLPLLRISGEEAFALTLANRTFAAWQGSALGKILNSALAKVGQVAGGAVSVPVSEIQPLLSAPQIGGEYDREHAWFGSLLEAVRRKRVLKIRYKKPTSNRAENRTVWPLHLAFMDHQWVLVFWDPNKEEPRKFLLNRMEAVEKTHHSFHAPLGFDLHGYLKNSFGRFTGDDVIEVKIHFDKVVAPFIRERLYHSSQQIEELPDGEIHALFKVNHLMDIQRWVHSWGSHAEVLKPEKLRAQIAKEIKVLTKKYEQTRPQGQVLSPQMW